MKTKNLILSTAILALASPFANARQLSVQEALAAAGAAMPDNSMTMAPAAQYKAFTFEKEGINTVYVLNAFDNGYLILAADDVAPAILGYSDNGSFDPNNMPSNMKAWLEDYSNTIAAAVEKGCSVVAAPINPSLKDIAPLLTTKWNQDAPYNDLCPRVNKNGQELPTYTGCVATAMAQVAKYHKHPAHGYGSNSYNWNGTTLSLDFSEINFDWDNMLDTYDSNSTAEQNNAVAELMYACGIACNMGYGTSASGANSTMAILGMVYYLDYDVSASCPVRDFYGLVRWNEMLHNELASGRPIYYSGANANAGHAFVVDGYNSSDGFYHVNWGWGGASDGYYSIISLDPDAQGIGGSTDGYYLSQQASFNLKPAEDSTETAVNIACYNLLEKTVSYSRNEYVLVGENGENGGAFINYSLTPFIGEFGLELTDASGNNTYLWWPYGIQECDWGSGWYQYEIAGKDFPTEGTYTARPVVRADGEEKVYTIDCMVGTTKEFTVKINGDRIVFIPISQQWELSLTSAEALTPIFRDKQNIIEATITNTANEYYGYVTANITSAGNDNTQTLGKCIVDITEGNSQTITIYGSMPLEFPTGEATIHFYDDNNTEIGEGIVVNVESAPSGTPAISLSNAVITTAISGSGSYGDPFIVDPANIKMSTDIYNASGYFTNAIRAYIFKEGEGGSSTFLQAKRQFVSAGESKTLEFDGDLNSQIQKGALYYINFIEVSATSLTFVESSPIICFKASESTTSVDQVEYSSFGLTHDNSNATVTAPAEIATVEVFNTTGILCSSYKGSDSVLSFSLNDLSAGYYLIRVTTVDGQTQTLRLVRR